MNAKQNAALAALTALTYEQIQDLLPDINRIIRAKGSERQQEAAAEFRVGQIVEFDSRKRGVVVRIKIERINRRTLSGFEVDAKGKRIAGPGWKVAPSFVRPTTK